MTVRVANSVAESSCVGASVNHWTDHIAAELERHQPPSGRGRDCWFVASRAVSTRLPLVVWSGSPADMAALGVEQPRKVKSFLVV